MNPTENILKMLFLAALFTACNGTDDKLPHATDYADVRFTALRATDRQTKTDDDATAGLNDKGNVAVYAWKSATPAETVKHDYFNQYTFNQGTGTCDLAPVNGEMKLPVGTYSFYALSSNDATWPAPAMETGCRTATLRNGVDYLMAVAGSTTVSNDAYGPFSLVFRHIAAQVVLTVTPADKNGYSSAEGLTVSIAPIDSTGSHIDLSKTWSVDSPNSMIYWATDATGGTPLDRADGQVKTASQAQSGSGFTVSFILLPVAADAKIPLQFDFTGIKFTTGGTADNKRYTAKLPAPTNGGLNGGYTYTFTAKISRQEVTFTDLPKVNAWVTDGIGLDEVIEVDPK